ncbi:hypothetical protein BC351_22715 [Paenibacillus ferrarius]|uniref:Anti-sigma-W factor RsiW n=1 Tax=Paenibacillus ferrarius TaxID=1469647 RepID=A0A1V4HM73_9BACL|nr:zf-HC2 domain-containing protein [Paenibacillus ferrarius]OPH58624.1 hypothetical protein BC351_22715 [Paenibacillus ferrarius]
MNCQEVMEFMQRQLDGDLDVQEEDELHAHLARCLDCAQMFERLQKLSDELTQLPKVVPPYSLVDAIMPQLAELDRQHDAASITDKVAVIGTSTSQTAPGQTSKLPRTRRIGSQFSWKFAGGIVAAGLILGFFVFNLNHPVLDNADGLMQPQSKSESRSAGQGGAGDLGNKAAANSMAVQPSSSPESKPEGTPTPTQEATSDAPKTERKADDAAGAGTAPQATTSAKLEEPLAISKDTLKGSDQVPVAPSTTEPERMKDPNTVKDSVINPVPGATNPPVQRDTSAKHDDAKAANQAKAGEQKTAPLEKKSEESSDSFGIQSFYVAPPAVTSLKSASEVYLAVVEEQHVVIRNSATKAVVFESKHIWQTGDQISLLEWSKDDILFYQTQSGDNLQSFRIDLKAKTEVSP